MVADNLLNNVLSLPIDQRLELYSRLRESLQHHPLADSITDEDKRLLDERAEDIQRNPEDELPWEEVEARLDATLRDRR